MTDIKHNVSPVYYTEEELTDDSAAAQLTLFTHLSTNCSTSLNTEFLFSAFWLQIRTQYEESIL